MNGELDADIEIMKEGVSVNLNQVRSNLSKMETGFKNVFKMCTELNLK